MLPVGSPCKAHVARGNTLPPMEPERLHLHGIPEFVVWLGFEILVLEDKWEPPVTTNPHHQSKLPIDGVKTGSRTQTMVLGFPFRFPSNPIQ